MILSKQLTEAIAGTDGNLSPPQRNPDIHGGLWHADQEAMRTVNDQVVPLLKTIESALQKDSGIRWKMRKRTQDWVATFSAPKQKAIILTWRPSVRGHMSISFHGNALKWVHSVSTTIESFTPSYVQKIVGEFVERVLKPSLESNTG